MSLMTDKVWDLAGVGFGPANLSIAVSYENSCRKKATVESDKISMIFLEKRPGFDWHPGLLIDDAEMQISFLKDLITLRDPTSEFTFLNYLRSTGGLLEFANLRSFYALRTEFRDYMRWAADTLSNYVAYGTAVTNVTPNTANGGVHSLTVHLRKADGREARITTRNLAVAVGGTPRWPEWLDRQSCTGVFHSSEFLQALKAKYPDALSPYRFVVMGAGQSSAEMFRHLYASYPNAVVTLVIAGFALRPADDSEFVNEIFDPTMVDVFYQWPDCQRRKLLDEYANTNYAVADPGLISAIYKDMYLSKRMTGRLRLIPAIDWSGSSRTAARRASLCIALPTGGSRPSMRMACFSASVMNTRGSRASSAILRRILSAMKRTILTLDATIQFDAGLISNRGSSCKGPPKPVTASRPLFSPCCRFAPTTY